jgi:putative hemolysin
MNDLASRNVRMKSLMIAALVFALTGCTTPQAGTPASTTSSGATTTSAGRANPASVYCVQRGGRLDLRRDAHGNVSGICVFGNGNECEEWALFRDQQCVAPRPAVPTSSAGIR